MPSFYISAAHKSSGKTTLSIGLSAAIRQRGLSLQTFKKGPDYIDPIWLTRASGSPCYNLDFFNSSHAFILQQYDQYTTNKDAILVEGNMGLFDGISLDGSDSNAAMAKLLQLPVILVVDCSGTSRSIAPLLNGYLQFDKNIHYAGVILNKLAGKRHETKLREVVETYTDFKILGAVHRNNKIKVTERHLGLIPSHEMPDQANTIIELLAHQVNQFIDVDNLLADHSSTTRSDHKFPPAGASQKPATPNSLSAQSSVKQGLRIAIAIDQAFGFYYPGDIRRFDELGVELVPFNTLTDSHLPENLDGLFIGGGFPETRIERLAANSSLLKSVRDIINEGLPTYAECGGLMYLCSGFKQGKKIYPLCDVIPATVTMKKRPQGRGYVILQSKTDHPWYKDTGLYSKDRRPVDIRAHEFHYSLLQDLPDDLRYAYSVKRGTGIDGLNDGILMGNLVASYTHLRQTDQCFWVDNFVSFVRSVNK